MSSLLRRTIRAIVAPDHILSCSVSCWRQGLSELQTRGAGKRESGAFLLGTNLNKRRHIEHFAYFDDLSPGALNAEHIIFEQRGYSKLWKLCRQLGMQVVADVHTHPQKAFLSPVDQANPMIPQPGHIAIVLPNFGQDTFHRYSFIDYGFYHYQGNRQWNDYSGESVSRFFYIGNW